MSASLLPTPNQWKSYFKSRGLDDDTISSYLSYIRPLHKKRIPVIFGREHLAKLLGRTEVFLAAASLKPNYFYRNFEIPKRFGGKRLINAPYPSLLECHRWINKEILSSLPIHKSAQGYVRNKSIIDHAQPHVGPKAVLTMDLKDFFPSINLARVIALFREIGYTNNVALTLARLCCLNNVLPQGAPTSPAISNIICNRFDSRVAKLCLKIGVTYTRYADDLCFSGDSIPDSLGHSLNSIAISEGFKINPQKTHMHSNSSNCKMVTGLNVAFGELKLLKVYKRSISLDLYHIETHGLFSHLAKRKINNPNYLSTLLGKVGYWLQIEPNNIQAIRFKEILKTLIAQQ